MVTAKVITVLCFLLLFLLLSLSFHITSFLPHSLLYTITTHSLTLFSFIMSNIYNSFFWHTELLFLPISIEFPAHNYCCQFSPLILPHGCSEIFSLVFMFHLLNCHICLAIFLDSRSGWLIGNPHNTLLLWLLRLLLHPHPRVHSSLGSSIPWSLTSFPLSRWEN